MESVQGSQDGERFELGRAAAGMAGAVIGPFLLGIDAAVWLLLAAQAADFLSGVVAAMIRREVDSRVGWTGIGRKVLVWCAVGLVAGVQRYLETLGVRVSIPLPALGDLRLPAVGLAAAVCVGYAAVEAMSVAENLKKGGVWVPPWVTDRLARFRPPAMNGSATGFGRPAAIGEPEAGEVARRVAGR